MPHPDTWVGPFPDYDVTQLADQRVVCAAQRNRTTGAIVTGARHFDKTMHNTIALIDPNHEQGWAQSQSGFIDQFGTFLTREEAWIVATLRGQIIRRCGNDERQLFSENLY
jgi:hypothetical protein